MNATWADIIWYVVIGAFFIMMMRRGGCCGGHGHKKSHDKESGVGHDNH